MEFLKTLHIESDNNGVSTGSKWIKSQGEIINSYSPVDGKLIGSVTAADKNSYEQVINSSSNAFIQWRLMPARNVAK